MNPDKIAHILAVNKDSSVRVTLRDHQATIPIEPCPPRGSPLTETVPISGFDAVVEMVDVTDGGETLWAHLRLSESEWERVGFATHWKAENAEDHGDSRIIEVWANRFDNYEEYEDTKYIPPVPDNSPVLKEWTYTDEAPLPPAPLSQPKVEMNAMYSEEIQDYGDVWETVKVGTVSKVAATDDLDEWPEKRETRSASEIWDIDEGDPSTSSHHPTIDFNKIEAIEPRPELLEAIFTTNRHAKRLGDAADEAYRANRGADAKKYSVRKYALYDLKTIALHRIAKHEDAKVALEKHEINEYEYWCFYFTKGGEQWSFHQPIEAVNEDVIEQLDADSASISTEQIDFNPSSNTDGLAQSLEEALTVLYDEDLNVNEYLSQTVVTKYQFGAEMHEDIRWSHLVNRSEDNVPT